MNQKVHKVDKSQLNGLRKKRQITKIRNERGY